MTIKKMKKKPSAGLTKKQRSAVVKKAIDGKDIGKKGPGFKKIFDKAKKKYGAESARKIAATSMWRGIKRK